ncbi:PREDICTED: glucose dehydrogenase [FAD, quinone]-like [Wasmannia auropunctata]|uniref:glucose dehydrogenase [FAD, quinone]-like n=1 Tax=Wasmannia auropunctata TaxID=64793 RepID=UPI0005EF4018|nr:PREDICTED: glucose dehydrogenase [FAD, quinone]-like [Wasmannia auropunctata]
MLNKIQSLLYILNINAMIFINSLYGHPCYNSLHDNNSSELKLSKFLKLDMKHFLLQTQHYLNQETVDMTPQYGDTFDFIIIGAGTAGIPTAARLSEISQIKTLLLEAGSHENLYMDIPITAPNLLLDNNINWNYKTKSSNKYCRGMNGNRCVWPRGKVVGGSSTINGMIATRGGAEDYDRWADMGNEGWAYEDIHKYFKKLETMNIPELKSDTIYHGTDGPVHITSPSYKTSLAEAFLKAGKELRYPIVDYNGKNMIGFSYVQATIMNGTRMSSNRAYLHPIRNRDNLHIILRSMVTKILIDSSTKRAVGVEFIKNNRTIHVNASKEVILCAGAIGSPQLLMLSGIGPEKHLTELGIKVIQNAPVGENLMDHPVFFGLTWTINASISLTSSELFNPINPYMTEFVINRTGPWTSPGFIETLAFINTKHPDKHSGLPDIELLFTGIQPINCIIPTLINVKDPLSLWIKYGDCHSWFTLPILLKPKSRGRITLLANDVNVKPEIVPNYFDDPNDVKTMIAGIRTALKIGQTKTMQKFDSQLLNITHTECKNDEYDSDAYWECMIRIQSSTIFHPSGTCKMGPRGDPTAVVDPRLKVIGISRLRVVDASIMPEIISAHLSIPVYMIAEKAADMIKEDWGYLEKLR